VQFGVGWDDDSQNVQFGVVGVTTAVKKKQEVMSAVWEQEGSDKSSKVIRAVR
jgi:hypothetical protein